LIGTKTWCGVNWRHSTTCNPTCMLGLCVCVCVSI
jgi:hypothetical protein